MDKEKLKVPFAVNKKFHCDHSRFVILRKAIESELASLEWELNSPLLSAHINPMDYPIVPEIAFLSDRIKSKIKKYLLLKFAFALIDRKYVEFDTEREHKLAKEWLQEVLNILVPEIISENRCIRQQHLELIEIFIDFKELFSAENTGKRPNGVQSNGNSSSGGNKAVVLSTLENLSLQNQQAAKQFNKYATGVKKRTKESKNTHEVLWKKPHIDKSQLHSKGKKAKNRQNHTYDTKDTFKWIKEVDNDNEHNIDTKERKIREDENNINNRKTNISEKQTVQTIEEQGTQLSYNYDCQPDFATRHLRCLWKTIGTLVTAQIMQLSSDKGGASVGVLFIFHMTRMLK